MISEMRKQELVEARKGFVGCIDKAETIVNDIKPPEDVETLARKRVQGMLLGKEITGNRAKILLMKITTKFSSYKLERQSLSYENHGI